MNIHFENYWYFGGNHFETTPFATRELWVRSPSCLSEVGHWIGMPSGPFLVSRTGAVGWTKRGVKVPKWKLIRSHERCWLLKTAGRWPWKSESAKECVTTHLPKQLALKMDGAKASHLYPSEVRPKRRGPQSWSPVGLDLSNRRVRHSNLDTKTLPPRVVIYTRESSGRAFSRSHCLWDMRWHP